MILDLYSRKMVGFEVLSSSDCRATLGAQCATDVETLAAFALSRQPDDEALDVPPQSRRIFFADNGMAPPYSQTWFVLWAAISQVGGSKPPPNRIGSNSPDRRHLGCGHHGTANYIMRIRN